MSSDTQAVIERVWPRRRRFDSDDSLRFATAAATARVLGNADVYAELEAIHAVLFDGGTVVLDARADD